MTPTNARLALSFWLAPMGLDNATEAAIIAAALAIVARPLWVGPMPATYIQGPPGSGKTRLANALSNITSARPMVAHAAIHLRPSLAEAAARMPLIAIVDSLQNAPRASSVDLLAERITSHNLRVINTNEVTPLRTSWLITSTSAIPTPDLARRCILIDLTGAIPADLDTVPRARILAALYALLSEGLNNAANPAPPVAGPFDDWFAVLAGAGLPTTLASAAK